VRIVTAHINVNGATLVISATLVGSDSAHAEGTTVTAAYPVIELCRWLLAAGYGESLPMIHYQSVREAAPDLIVESRS
jgi:hypothetical protein